jgi:hypothetical protein
MAFEKVSGLSEGKILPHLWQLQVILSLLKGRDVILSAGTGSRKTLCFILDLLVNTTSWTLTIYSLKCLQISHVSFYLVSALNIVLHTSTRNIRLRIGRRNSWNGISVKTFAALGIETVGTSGWIR